MNIINAFSYFTKSINQQDISFNTNGHVSLMINDEFYIHFQINSKKRITTIFSTIGDLIEINETEFLKSLLSANYFGQGTNKFSFGMNPETEKLILFSDLNDEIINRYTLEERITGVIDSSIYWREKLTEAKENSDFNSNTTEKETAKDINMKHMTKV